MTRFTLSAASLSLAVLLGCPPSHHDQPPAATHALSGTVTRAWGGALPGVAVTLGGAATASATTDASGRYTFPGLADGNYTLTPALAGWVFAPSAPSVAVSGADAIRDFSADGAYTIAGKVSGSVQGGVSIALGGGGVVKPAAVSAAGTGAYAFTGIPNGTYTLTPAMAGHFFTPLAPTVTVSNANATQDFTSGALVAIRGKALDGFGAPLSGMTMRLTGAAAALATTDASGAFAFTDLVPGGYTVTAATFGYAFTPDARSYTLAADVTNADFAGSPWGPGTYTYTGTLSYSGTKTGPVYVTVASPFGGGGNPAGGTALASQAAPWSDRAFTARYVQTGGPVVVRAWMDTLGVGRFNAGADPSVTVGATTTGSPFDVGALTLVDPAPTPTVATPVAVNGVIPGDGMAVVVIEPPRDANGDAVADGFVVSWNDSATVDATHRRGTITVPAGPDFAVVHGLANGTGYWFRVDAYLGGAPLTGQSAVTTAAAIPAPPSGSATVAGTVTHPAVASPSALYVAAQGSKGAGAGGVHVQRIANPTGTQTAYALTVPAGTYQIFAFIDVGDDGALGAGEPALFPHDGLPLVRIPAGSSAGPTIAIPGAGASATITTSRWSSQWGSWGGMTFTVASGSKRPLTATVTGPGLRGPVDLCIRTEGGGSGFELGTSVSTDPIAPFTGDPYAIQVTYTDGTSETFQRSVTGVFGSPPMVVAPADGAQGVATVPTFRWSAPSGAPGAYAYDLQIFPLNGGDGLWETFLPSTETSVVYDADGLAATRQLAPYTSYGWTIRAIDANGNEGAYQASLTTGAPALPSFDPLDGTTLDGRRWQTPRFTREISGGKAVLRVEAEHMQARTLQGTTYTNAIGVQPGAGNRVTSLQATVNVPASSKAQTGTALLQGGIRLIYQPSASRGALFPDANANLLAAELHVFDDGTGPRLRRRFFHCDDAACIAFGNSGITVSADPDGFTPGGVNATAAAQYDTPYVLKLSLDESSGLFTWSVQGGAFTTAVGGTADVSTWASGVGMTLGSATNGFAAANILSRVSDETGGSSGRIGAEFDDVVVGMNGQTPALWDDFGSGVFGTAKWGAVDSDVSLSTDGLHLASALTTAGTGGGGESTPLNVIYPTSFTAWQADLAILSEPAAPDAGLGNGVTMVGAFYNDGTPGTGAMGDVRARVTLQSGSASYQIFRCTTANCSASAGVAFGALAPSAAHPLGLGTVHTLFAQWDAPTRLFTFLLDDAPPVQVDPTHGNTPAPVSSPTPRYPLHTFTGNVSIAATAAPGTSASLEATVANVRGQAP